MFITLEGGEGGGKSTNLVYIEKLLTSSGREVVVTREPGGTALGEKIRHILLDPENKGMDDRAELLLIFAARAHHLSYVIQPALRAGKTVLCDRFTDATYAYQGNGRGLPFEDIAILENWVQGELRPNLTLLLDLDIEIGMKRASARGEKDRFEKQEMAFFQKVRNGYLQLAEQNPKQYCIIDAAQSIEVVQNQIHRALTNKLNLKP